MYIVPIDICMRLCSTERIARNQYHILREHQRGGINKKNNIRTYIYYWIYRQGKGEYWVVWYIII